MYLFFINMPPYSRPIITNSHSSSLSNPCPEGTGIGYGDWNGTILVICDAAFNKALSQTDSLALGLGLGLGIPGFLLLAALLGYYWHNRESLFPSWRNKGSVSPPSAAASKIAFLSDSITFLNDSVREELSAQSLNDLHFGILSEGLKEELMTIRIKKGCDLVDYIRYAERSNQPEIADWIHKMNPCDFPRHIREKGAEHHIVHVSGVN